MDKLCVKRLHSSHFQTTGKSSTDLEIYSKSDFDLSVSNISHSNPTKLFDRESPAEYYKRYEHDVVPPKDSNQSNFPCKGSLTNTDLDKIESRVYKNISQELQTDESSLGSLESNIKFFKTTVEKVFDNFNTCMRDFELYKKRFHDILEKNTQGSIEDMEDFIKDMFEHIMSSDNSSSNINNNISDDAVAVNITSKTISCYGDTSDQANISESIVDAYLNENYLTDSTVDVVSIKGKSAKIEELLNLLLLNDNNLHLGVDTRTLLSEVNIRETCGKIEPSSTVSADNIKTMVVRRMETETYDRHQNNIPDREIPVKVSYAKKNISLNEDFARKENTETSKSLFSKICNIICKTFRKL